MDFSRSILTAARTAPPAKRPFDGIDILRAVRTNRPLQHRTLFWRARRAERTRKAVRDGSMKYIHLRDGEKATEYLFDLAEDPAEKNNLLTKRPDETRRLKALLADWEKKVQHNR